MADTRPARRGHLRHSDRPGGCPAAAQYITAHAAPSTWGVYLPAHARKSMAQLAQLQQEVEKQAAHAEDKVELEQRLAAARQVRDVVYR